MFSDISYSQEHRPHLIMDDKKLMPHQTLTYFVLTLRLFFFFHPKRGQGTHNPVSSGSIVIPNQVNLFYWLPIVSL